MQWKCPVDTGRKLNVHKTFNLRPVSTGWRIKMKGVNKAVCKSFLVFIKREDPV